MTDQKSHQDAVDRNFSAFEKMLPELATNHLGKFALLRDEKVVEIFDSARDALVYARAQYSDGLYSVQEINRRVVDLGYFSHAVPVGSV